MLAFRHQDILLQQPPHFDDFALSLQATVRQPKAMLNETRKIIALARQFNKAEVKPYALDLDRKIQQTPDYLAEDFIRMANQKGLFSLWIPKIFGGKGYNLPSVCYFLEELASGCTGMANLIGVHYLGVATLISSWNSRVIQKVFKSVIDGEKKGRPNLISLALTEPDAGTDVEDADLLDRGRVSCHARRVTGGYVVNGRKVFISNGHLSRWHILFAFADLDRPSANLVLLAVEKGMDGFSLGRIEHKMGQKGCPASELIFDECFVPDAHVCIDPVQASKLQRSRSRTTSQIIDYLFSASRAGVAAFGAGVARGAYETALAFCARTRVQGRRLINHQWAQSQLAEMYKNAMVARLCYVESNYANSLYGMYRLLQLKPLYYIYKYTPSSVLSAFLPAFFEHRLGTWLLRKVQYDHQSDAQIERTSGWGSLAKFTATDAGVTNAQMALDLMGQAGLRQDQTAEKHLRDARLLQIYEGTNQLNRINLFKCLIGRDVAETKVFEE